MGTVPRAVASGAPAAARSPPASLATARGTELKPSEIWNPAPGLSSRCASRRCFRHADMLPMAVAQGGQLARLLKPRLRRRALAFRKDEQYDSTLLLQPALYCFTHIDG